MTVTSTAGDSTLSRIIEMVQGAQAKRPTLSSSSTGSRVLSQPRRWRF